MDEGEPVVRPTAPAVSAKASHIASLTNEAELDALIDLLPPRVRGALATHQRKLQLLEVVLDLGRLPIARFADGDEILGDGLPLDYDDIERAMDTVGEVGGDNRAGINRTLHRISVIRNRKGGVVGLTARVGRAIEGSADLVRDLLASGASVLLLGRPGVGKTTAIREISRILSEEYGRRVVVVDTSNEIGGDGDIPHPGIGGSRRMQVPVPDRQHDVLIEAVQNHTPQVVIVDEIGTELEAKAARTISQRGVQMIATAHGHTLENLLKNPLLNDLVGGVVSVTLGDDEARRRRVQKSVLEREGPPTFGAAVEMVDIGHWRVHLDVGVAVDTLLAGYAPHVELRTLDADTGAVRVQPYLGGGEIQNGGSYAAMFGAGGAVSGGVGFGASVDNTLGSGGPSFWGDVSASGFSFPKAAPTGRSTATDDPDDQSVFRIYPHELDCDVLEEVIASLELEDRVVLTDQLEDASAVLAVKARVKGATWLRHAARARGMPIYALKVEGMPQLARAMQAMLGLNGLNKSTDDRDAAAADASMADAAAAAAARGTGRDVSSVTPADEIDALEEVRMAVEQLVIPHQEPVELLPRDERLLKMQADLITDEYRLQYEECGEGSSRRIKILHTYVGS
ncbi:predicted protein [Micromonas commoda]|uniref:AAA+ ATPase domain-containing protein n=1 Tax=Micromonas commoda (strain RCC299 / NOUM17 / CCMP2709) TaxID=296587 RepID=C1EJG6_MICCC|nr:predicted protein [Micromonas commoda]ACO68181.1 predicted protein [Micromonas commoda]|eukprot:XP_002506923.1 predicted protein [Micromonas commoda]